MKKTKVITVVLGMCMAAALAGCGSSKVSNEDFLADLAAGVQARVKVAEEYSEESNAEIMDMVQDCFTEELDAIEKYEKAEFKDKELGELAKEYIESLNAILDACDEEDLDMVYDAGDSYDKCLEDFLDDYDLLESVGRKYKDDVENYVDAGFEEYFETYLTEDAVADSAEEAEDITEDIVEDVTEEAEDVTEDIAEDVTEEVTEDVTEDITEDVTEDVTEEAEDVTEDITEDVTEDVAEDTTIDASQTMADPSKWTDVDLVFVNDTDTVVVEKDHSFICWEDEAYYTTYENGDYEEWVEDFATSRGLKIGMSMEDYIELYDVKKGYAVWELYSTDSDGESWTSFDEFKNQDPSDIYDEGYDTIWLDIGYYKDGNEWKILRDYEVQDTWFCDADLDDYEEVIVFAVNIDSWGQVCGLSLEYFDYGEGWVEWQGWAE